MAQLVNSIRMNGVLKLVIARRIDEDHYELKLVFEPIKMEEEKELFFSSTVEVKELGFIGPFEKRLWKRRQGIQYNVARTQMS